MRPHTNNTASSKAPIDEILARLSAIIAESEKINSRLGYFAALYCKVTASIKDGILGGRFQNGRRMEQLDVIFASRYLDALTAWKAGKPLTESWRLAFAEFYHLVDPFIRVETPGEDHKRAA